MSLSSKTRWRECTRPHPCPSCGKSGWCQMTEDGLVMCRRYEQPGSLARTDRTGSPYYLWRQGGLRKQPLLCRPPTQEPRRADPDTLDRIYRSLLLNLPLSERHRSNLHARGLCIQAIVSHGYRSMPGQTRLRIARELAEQYGDALLSVPGFFLHSDGDKSWPSLAGGKGLLVPVHDLAGRTIALLIRKDELQQPDESRYYSLSSKKHGGPGAGSHCHVPFGTPSQTDMVRITEGPIKSNIAWELTGIPTLGVPGVGAWRKALPILTQLRPKTLRIAWDMDWQNKNEVRCPLIKAIQLFVRCGFRVGIEHWDARKKGIDDALAAALPIETRWIGEQGGVA